MLWRFIFSNRRLFNRVGGTDGFNFGDIPIPYSLNEVRGRLEYECQDIKLSEEGAIFGHEYLKLLDSNRYDEICSEWLAEEKRSSELPACGTPSTDDEGVAIPDDSVEATVMRVLSGELDCDFFEDEIEDQSSRDAAFKSISESGRPKRKFCRLKGLHSTPSIIKLDKWSDLVRGVVRELIASAPQGNATAEAVYKEYLRKTLDETDQALRSGRKPLPLHPIGLDCIKTYMKKLNSCRAGSITPTVRGLEIMAGLSEALQNPSSLTFNEPPPVEIQTNGVLISSGPLPVSAADIAAELMCSELERAAGDSQRVTPCQREDNDIGIGQPLESPPAESQPPNRGHLPQTDNRVVSEKNTQMACRFCQKPLARGFNNHDHSQKEYGKYGRCPLDTRPAKPTNIKELTERARHAALGVTVGGNTGIRKCNFCDLPLVGHFITSAGVLMRQHEVFADEDGHLLRYCPFAENIDKGRLTQLDDLKQRRIREKLDRKRAGKRQRYAEKVEAKRKVKYGRTQLESSSSSSQVVIRRFQLFNDFWTGSSHWRVVAGNLQETDKSS